MFRKNSTPHREYIKTLLHVARLYYNDNLSQSEIANRIGYSRATVSRMLTEARNREIVKITISHPIEYMQKLEELLKQKYNLQNVRISENEGTQGAPKLAADFIIQHAGRNSLIAVSNGSSIALTVDKLEKQHWSESCVVQMIGALGHNNPLEDSPEICRRMAERLGGRYRPMPVPLVLDSPTTAANMRKEGQVANIMELSARADMAIVGIGAVIKGARHGILEAWNTPQIAAQIEALGAVAHLCSHHLDAQGKHLHTPLCDRTIALDPERLKAIPQVVAIAWGIEKVPALRASIAGGYINTLVTDEITAKELLKS